MKSLEAKKLGWIAQAIDAELVGDPDCLVIAIAPLEQAVAGEVSFLNNRYYRKYLATTQASAVILHPDHQPFCKTQALVCKNPRLSLVKAARLFAIEPFHTPAIHPSAVIGQDCQIAHSVSIGAGSVIGDRTVLSENVMIGAGTVIAEDCKIGHRSQLYARVTLYKDVKIGADTVVHSGVVIGSDGFGFANDAGRWIKMPHQRGVCIGDAVEIGANTTIDRGVFEDTVIADNVIIDNLVQIAHNVRIGAHTAIAACVAIGGSTVIGEACLIGGGTSIAGHLTIADQVHIMGTSAVNQSLNTAGAYASGFPAKPVGQWRKNVARFQYLDAMAKRLTALEKQLGFAAAP